MTIFTVERHHPPKRTPPEPTSGFEAACVTHPKSGSGRHLRLHRLSTYYRPFGRVVLQIGKCEREMRFYIRPAFAMAQCEVVCVKEF